MKFIFIYFINELQPPRNIMPTIVFLVFWLVNCSEDYLEVFMGTLFVQKIQNGLPSGSCLNGRDFHLHRKGEHCPLFAPCSPSQYTPAPPTFMSSFWVCREICRTRWERLILWLEGTWEKSNIKVVASIGANKTSVLVIRFLLTLKYTNIIQF